MGFEPFVQPATGYDVNKVRMNDRNDPHPTKASLVVVDRGHRFNGQHFEAMWTSLGSGVGNLTKDGMHAFSVDFTANAQMPLPERPFCPKGPSSEFRQEPFGFGEQGGLLVFQLVSEVVAKFDRRQLIFELQKRKLYLPGASFETEMRQVFSGRCSYVGTNSWGRDQGGASC